MNQLKRAVLFCNGELNNKDFHIALLKKDDFIIAVDGGGNHCQNLGIKPNLALGDFDSLALNTLNFYRENQVETLTYPCDKDYIDLALGIEEAIKRNYEEIIILGALGGKRRDMELGNILLLSKYEKDITIINENTSIKMMYPQKKLVINNEKNKYFSLIPLSKKVVTGESHGLKYQLLDLEFTFGETRSISNEILADECQVVLKSGEALGICQNK
ncbi:MAG: thiamine diphosphokinase [Clostridiales bacterium]